MTTEQTTTWDLSEFTDHRRRLTRLKETVANNRRTAEQARDDNGDAYGLLFGWAVTPFLNRVCDRSEALADQLTTALQATADAIEASQRAYADTELSAADATAVVNAAVASAAATAQGN
ncbi:hypothetical protein ACSDQ9_11335 [Aestuariimicrobium soli]|uniref:hypothetical protein n=1 Tax=Aestuariimicrobium soli TaxID=2035834 RepID=UPI003EBC78B2